MSETYGCVYGEGGERKRKQTRCYNNDFPAVIQTSHKLSVSVVQSQFKKERFKPLAQHAIVVNMHNIAVLESWEMNEHAGG